MLVLCYIHHFASKIGSDGYESTPATIASRCVSAPYLHPKALECGLDAFLSPSTPSPQLACSRSSCWQVTQGPCHSCSMSCLAGCPTAGAGAVVHGHAILQLTATVLPCMRLLWLLRKKWPGTKVTEGYIEPEHEAQACYKSSLSVPSVCAVKDTDSASGSTTVFLLYHEAHVQVCSIMRHTNNCALS